MEVNGENESGPGKGWSPRTAQNAVRKTHIDPLKEPCGAICTPRDSDSKEPAGMGVCVLVLDASVDQRSRENQRRGMLT